MRICILDTETTSLDKPFAYDVGYTIRDTENFSVPLVERSFIVEQVWHNLPLFESAYYKEKRPLYVSAMRSKKAVMDKFGYICQTMKRDFKTLGVAAVFAYNAPFDDNVFAFNCDWYKCYNPLEELPVIDIRGHAVNFLVDEQYKLFCEENNLFTESGNYSTTAESMFRYITKDTAFNEAHTALDDSTIEAEILLETVNRGAEWIKEYKVPRSIPRITPKPLKIKINGQEIFNGEYIKKYVREGLYSFTTPGE